VKVSLNTVKQYVDIDLSVDELVVKINEQLGGVEEVIDFATKYQDVIVVRVVSCEKHPNADKLSVCWIDDGGVVDDIERNGEGHIQVVCGAPNVTKDIFVAWLPPRSTVPATYNTNEPFVLNTRELRGVKSNGMLAALDELDLGTDHEGILILDEHEWNPHGTALRPGVSFAGVYGLDDVVIDIENKMFTHRPDCFGVIGVAREIAGITHAKFSEPEWYRILPTFASAEGLELTVQNNETTAVPRFMAVALKNIEVKPSPLWMQCELIRLGSKSINNVVDVTNYVMLLTGQPLHAYDYDKVGSTISARFAKKGETVVLINDKTYTLHDSDIVITDGTTPIGLAGVMGGASTEVSHSTKNIILECANFDMYTVRKTSMRHGLFTDAVTRYNKGQSSLQQPYVIDLAMKSLIDVSGATQASEVFDISGTIAEATPVAVTMDFINSRLGTKLTTAAIISLLENVSITVEQPAEQNSELLVRPPFWRTDIELPEDVVEEVGRLYGYANLTLELPQRSSAPVAKNPARELKDSLRSILLRSGANEVVTYSFIHEKVLAAAGQSPELSYKLANALSPDLQFYRQSLLPSLADKINANVRAGYDEFCLYEFGKAHNKQFELTDEGLPSEQVLLEGVYVSRKPQSGAAYYRARRIAEEIFDSIGLPAAFIPATFADDDNSISAPFAEDRSAHIVVNGSVIGIVGELRHSVRKAFKLPDYVAAFSIDFDALLNLSLGAKKSHYRPLSKYPNISQDITIKTSLSTHFSDIQRVLNDAVLAKGDGIEVVIRPDGVYQPESGEYKTTTFHIEYTSFDKTLRDEDILPVVDSIKTSVANELSAEVV
jgi:phenylalanyl-tRNA synthetase beta chain